MNVPRLKRVKSDCLEGQAAIELIPTMLMFVAMLASVFGICVYLYLENIVITAAREGARTAAVNTDLGSPSTSANGVATVQNAVVSILKQVTGSTIPKANINVTPPSGTVGQRTVTVAVNFSVGNPIPIPDFTQPLQPGQPPAMLFQTIPLSAVATMHYEE